MTVYSHNYYLHLPDIGVRWLHPQDFPESSTSDRCHGSPPIRRRKQSLVQSECNRTARGGYLRMRVVATEDIGVLVSIEELHR